MVQHKDESSVDGQVLVDGVGHVPDGVDQQLCNVRIELFHVRGKPRRGREAGEERGKRERGRRERERGVEV